jgi:RNA polymerase sigma-70 factor (ECF subfamily)
MAGMDDTQDEFRRLLQQAAGRSPEAIQQLVECYTPHILRAVRRRLHRAIRSKFDSIDFTQAVWASFFTGIDQGIQFQRPEELVGYLATMARHKVIEELRRHLETDKYDVHRERSLDDPTSSEVEHVADPGPSPSEVMACHEMWQGLTEGAPAHYRRVLELRRAGHTYEQIAEQVGIHKKTVCRIIHTFAKGRSRGSRSQ